MTLIPFARLDDLNSYQPLNANLTAFAGLDSSVGVIAQTGAAAFAKRTITGTANRLAVTNGDGAAGNPTLDISATYVGQTSITTLGTIGSGTWQGSIVGLAFGGTGADLSATGGAGRYLKQNALGATVTVTQVAASEIASGAALTTSNDTNVTITAGGSASTSLLAAASLTMGWSGSLAIARGGTGATTQQAALNNIAPTPTRAGDIMYYNGTNWVALPGNNSGTQLLQESSSGIPSWFVLQNWSNTRLAKTAAYTAASADNGSTVALGGSAFFALTYNAPSGYSSTHLNLVRNEDSDRAKLLIPQFATSSTSFTIGTGSKAFTTQAGLNISTTQRYRVYSLANTANWMAGKATYSGTTFTLTVDATNGSGTFTDWQIAPEHRIWPGQERWIYNQNNVWLLSPRTRWRLPGSTEICVNASTGSDSNDGLGPSGTVCFAKIQTAADIVYQEWDANNFDPNIGLYTGPFNESVNLQGQITGYNFLRFRTRAANTWTNTGNCINVSDNAEAIFDAVFGFTQTWQCNTANAASKGAIFGHQVNVIDIGGAHQWIPSGSNDSFLYEDGEGRATINGTGSGIILGSGGTVTGGAYVWCENGCAGVTTGGTLSYSGNVTLGAFYVAKSGSIISHSTNPTNSPGTGTVGPALSFGASIIRQNGLTLPGGAIGTNPGAGNQVGFVCATSC